MLVELAFDILVTVEAELAIVGEVRAELEEEGAEVAVDAVEVILVDDRRCLHQPRVGRAGFRIAPLLRARDGSPLLRLADEQDALVAWKPRQILLGDVILALAFLEGDERDPLAVGEAFDRGNEGPRHRRHEHRAGEAMATVPDPEVTNTRRRLQDGNVEIEVEPIDALDL